MGVGGVVMTNDMYNSVSKVLCNHHTKTISVYDADADPAKGRIKNIFLMLRAVHKSLMNCSYILRICQIFPDNGKAHLACLHTVCRTFAIRTNVGKVPPFKHIPAVLPGNRDDGNIDGQFWRACFISLSIDQFEKFSLVHVVNLKITGLRSNVEINGFFRVWLYRKKGRCFLLKITHGYIKFPSILFNKPDHRPAY